MSSKQWAQLNDNKIFQLAFYYESKGMSIRVVDQEKIYARFSDFKRNLLGGEFTLHELEENVYSKFGIVSPTGVDTTESVRNFLQALKELSEEKAKKVEDGKVKEKEKGIPEDAADGSDEEGS